MSSKVKSNHKKTIQSNEEQDMLALLIGAANIVCSIIANWFKPSTLNLLFGLAFGAGFIYVGTQLKGRERAQPLLIASLTLAVFFLGRFWGSPLKEIFPSGILAALAGLGVYKYGTIIFA